MMKKAHTRSTLIIDAASQTRLHARRVLLSRHGRARLLLRLALFCSVLAAPSFILAQNVKYTENKADQSLRSDARVDPSTLGMSVEIPLGSFPGRAGTALPISLRYSSKLWRIFYSQSYPTLHAGIQTWTRTKFAENSAAGWTSSLDPVRIVYTGDAQGFDGDGNPFVSDDEHQNTLLPVYISRINVILMDGSSHELRKSDAYGSSDLSGTFYSTDGSRMIYSHTASGVYAANTLYLPDGSRYLFDPTLYLTNSRQEQRAVQYIDRNGNTLNYTPGVGQNNYGQWTDTLNRPLSVPRPETPTQTGDIPYWVAGINGSHINYTMRWKHLSEVLTPDPLTGQAPPVNYAGDNMCSGSTATPVSQSLFIGGDTSSKVCVNGIFDPIVLSQIVLPHDPAEQHPPAYTFTYNVYGEIDKLVLPTGGYERYRYAQIPLMSMTDGSLYDQANRGVVERWVSAKGDGTDEADWKYEVTTGAGMVPPYKVKITAPDNSYTERLLYMSGNGAGFGFDPARTGMAYDEKVFSATNQMLRRTLTEWTSSGPQPGGYGGAQRDPKVTKTVEILCETGSNTALYRVTTNSYDQLSQPLNLTSSTQYGYATISLTAAQNDAIDSGSFPVTTSLILRTTETSYKEDTTYTTRNMVSLPISTRAKDGAGNIVARSQINYDEDSYAPLPCGATTGWSDPGTGVPRGNATTVGQWLNTNDAYLQTHSQYDGCGNARVTIDAKGNQSQVEYDNSFYAYPTKLTTPVPDPQNQHGSNVAFTSTSTFDATTGRVLSATDANGKVTTFEYAATDALGAANPYRRLTKVTRPTGGGWTAFAYGEQPGNLFTMTRTAQDQTINLEAYQYFDGLGRPTRAAQAEGGNSFIYADTQYDAMGRVSQASNPYRTGETVRWTANAYDDLGRVYTVTMPDGAQGSTTYGLSVSGTTLGQIVTVTDQAHKQRKSVTDALGRLVQVYEDPAGSNYLTTYAYDVLGNLRTVSQGVQTRTFLYDSLSRLTSATNPESGTIQYLYDNNSNLILKIDPRPRPGNLTLSPCPVTYTGNNIATCYDYDALNRVKTRSYNDGTPNVSYKYDTTTNGTGRLSSVTSSVSITSYDGYDQMGRVASSTQTTDGQSYTIANYAYDLAGHLIKEIYPSGRVVSTAYDGAGRLQSLSGQQTTEQAKSYADSPSYWSSGAVKDLRLGNGLWEHTEINNRLQPTEIDLGTQAGAVDRLKLAYSYETSTGGQSNHDNNGNVLSQTITVPQIGTVAGFTTSQTYQYDALNRLQWAQEMQGTTQVWKQTYTYADQQGQNSQYGNRRIDAGQTSANVLPSSNPSINPLNNRYDDNQGYGYDVAGNVTAAPNQTFSYDAENRQVTYNGGNPVSGGASYNYDGDGKRVKKVDQSGTTIFVYDAMGQMVAEYSNSTSSNADPDQTSYLTSDTLGTPRIITGSSEQVKARHDYLPFGEELKTDTASGATVRTEGQGYVYGLGNGKDKLNRKFTGKEHDGESGLDYFNARYYSSAQGRFTSPDEFTGGAHEVSAAVLAPDPLLYAEPTEPQSLNKYTYCLNNPLRYVDPDGHQTTQADGLIIATPQGVEAAANVIVSVGKSLANLAINANNVSNDFGIPGTRHIEPYQPEGGVQRVGMHAIDVGLVLSPLGGKAGPATMMAAEAEDTAVVVGEVGNVERASESAAGSARAARREAMRKEDIPTSQQPSGQVSTRGGRQYQYEVPKSGGGKETKIVTNQLRDRNHGPHFEAGRPKTPRRTDPGGRLRHTNDKTKVNY